VTASIQRGCHVANVREKANDSEHTFLLAALIDGLWSETSGCRAMADAKGWGAVEC
jgi:hypothetical protein